MGPLAVTVLPHRQVSFSKLPSILQNMYIPLKHVKTIQTRFLDNFQVSPTSIVSVVVANMRSNIYISLSGAHGKENTKPQHALVKRYEEKFKHCN